MDVGSVGTRAVGRILLAIGCSLLMAAHAQADPMYTAIDLGTGDPTFGNGTVTGSNGQTYIFNPVQNDLLGQASTGPGIPVPIAAPVNDPGTYGDPAFAFSNSTLTAMNAQGLAAGIDNYGVDGHLVNADTFVTLKQPDGSWGAPIDMWSGSETIQGDGGSGVQILGVASNGQILGIGSSNYYGPLDPTLFLYDTRTSTLTNLSSLIDGWKWASASQASTVPNWNLQSVLASFDDQGRILVQASEGPYGPTHELLLIPQGVPGDEFAAPEPAAWLLFAIMAGGWAARGRLRSIP